MTPDMRHLQHVRNVCQSGNNGMAAHTQEPCLTIMIVQMCSANIYRRALYNGVYEYLNEDQ